MPTVSGALKFDSARTGTYSASLSGIANVPIVLQETITNTMLAVYTDINGNYAFNNVPNGNYQIVESYGVPAIATPGDFSTAAPGDIAIGAAPPISYAVNPPAGATNLDSVTRSTFLITVSDANLTQNFLNGPVRYTPIGAILDDNVIVLPDNLINKADAGSFGFFAPGTTANSGVSPNPYPDINTDFIYVQPNPAVVTPNDGQYTIQNTMNNSHSNSAGTWWRITDHTNGNETGRMMVVNGFSPGAVIFEDEVPVDSNTYYLFSSWILNLGKQAGLENPHLGVIIFDSGGDILYNATLDSLIPINFSEPEWKQLGTAINSLDNTSLTVQFISMGPAASGNDFAIDDISFNEIIVPVITPEKSVDSSAINIGDTAQYTVTLFNTNSNPLSNIVVIDVIPDGLTFVPGSAIINGVSDPVADPNIGFSVPDVFGGGNLAVSFSATAKDIPSINPTINSAKITYSYSPVDGGIPIVFDTVTNDVAVRIIYADLAITKTANKNTVFAGDPLTYTITVTNNGPDTAVSPWLADIVPPSIKIPTYSIDGGISWNPWPGGIALPDMAGGESIEVLITGTVNHFASGNIINSATINSSTADPNMLNNAASISIPIEASADLSIVKTASPRLVTAGTVLTYTLVISNAGPSHAQNTTVTDTIPPELSNVQYSTDGGTTWQPWGGVYQIGLMESASVVTILIRGTVVSGSTINILNTATVDSSTADPDLSNNTSTAHALVNELADLDITMNGEPSPVQAGGILTYSIIATNNGPSDAQNTTITDELSSEITNAQYSTDGGLTWQLWTGVYNLGTMIHGGSFTLLVRGTVDSTATGTLLNKVIISSTTPDPDTTNNSAVVIIPIGTSADMSVSKTGAPSPVNHGQLLTYTINLHNYGPNDAHDVMLTDDTPSELIETEYSLDGGITWEQWIDSISIGTVPAGLTIPVLLRGTVSSEASGILTNTVTVSSSTPDPNPDNNVYYELTPVGLSADLSITKSADSSSVMAGSMLTYSLEITNIGPDDASNVVITDLVHPNLLNSQYSFDGISWLPWNDSLSLESLDNGASLTLQIRGLVDPSATESLTNTATIISDTPDPNPSNNTGTTTTLVGQCADLVIIKTSEPVTVIAGNLLAYTLTITNKGPSVAYDVILIDAIPSSIIASEFSTDNGITWRSWINPYVIGIMDANTSIDVLIRGTVSPAATGNISNTAMVSGSTPDPDFSNNSSTFVTQVEASADIAVVKISRPSPVIAGMHLTYTITVSNIGPSYAQGVVLTDITPPSFSNPQYSFDGGITWDVWSGSYMIGELANGSSVKIIIRGTADTTDSGEITNTAAVSGTTPDPNPDNNTSTVVTPFDELADISIIKRADQASAIVGSNLTFILDVVNIGPSAAKNVVITDLVQGMSQVQYSTDNGETWLTWNGTLNLLQMASGDRLTLLIRGEIPSGASGIIGNTATVESDTPDPDLSNNISSIVIPITAKADLAITINGDADVVSPGDILTYTLTVNNLGPSCAQNVSIEDKLPGSLSNVQYSADNGESWNIWNNIYHLDSLPNDTSITLLIRGTVGVYQSGIITNTATVTSSTPDPDLTNNIDTETTLIASVQADLAVSKAASHQQVWEGDLLTYSINVKNHGPDAAQGVVLFDDVPNGLTGVQFSMDSGITWQPWNKFNNLGTLERDEELTVLISGMVTSDARGNINNTVFISSTTPDPDMMNNFSSTNTAAPCPLPHNLADLSVVKTACPRIAEQGKELLYTIIVTNNGPGAAVNVILNDALSGDIHDTCYSIDDGETWRKWQGAICLGNMAANDYATVLIRGTVDKCARSEIANTAYVQSEIKDPNPKNNQFKVITKIKKRLWYE